MREDAQILALIRGGDAAAFTEIIERYEMPIQRYLYRLTGDYEIARDLAQDTFLQAYEGILKSAADISLKPWLYKIATNNLHRNHRRKKLISFIPLENLKTDTLKTESHLDIDEKMEIQKTLLMIPEEQRVCLALNIVEGFKCREVAATLGISEASVYKRLERGIQLFRKLYGGVKKNEL